MKKKNIIPLLFTFVLSSCGDNFQLDTITYKEYVEEVKQDKNKIIFVFTQTTCGYCKKLKEALKDYDLPDDVSLYEISLDVNKDSGDKAFVDETIGYANQQENDYLYKLDLRIREYALSCNISEEELFPSPTSSYKYISTPLVIWYKDNIEYKISNCFYTTCYEDNKFDSELFDNFMEFPTNKNSSWNKEFDLDYYRK